MPKDTLKQTKRSLAEKKVNLAINMTDVCVRISSDAIRDRYPRVNEEELLERVRKRIRYGRRREREV
ncbi:hypothetical protein MUP05_00975 [Candidatus Bathyarchaeota archaeon]|nr:hypothetical protein [Candidatus Bathyarchaeota archaeon]